MCVLQNMINLNIFLTFDDINLRMDIKRGVHMEVQITYPSTIIWLYQTVRWREDKDTYSMLSGEPVNVQDLSGRPPLSWQVQNKGQTKQKLGFQLP